jgi:HD superfamily phosphohydrolase
MRAKVFRDPVHDIIDWKSATRADVGALVCALVDAREMQRMRHIRQLGLASLVYHGAEHSRFAHSLGVAHVARRMCDRLPDAFDDATYVATICGALLHDIGHAPFSHVLERVFGFDHEARGEAIVLDEASEVHRVLRRHDPSLPERVAGLIAGREKGVARAVLSSQLDADRCDYLLRDAHMTGIGVGRYDLERILLMLDCDEHGLVAGHGAFEAVEGYLTARYHMYRLVYFHRAVRAAEAMLHALFSRARQLLADGRRDLVPANALGGLMRGEPVESGEYAALGEYHAWSLVASWRDDRDPVLSELAAGLLDRRLFKAHEREVGDGPRVREADDAVVARIRESLAPREQFLFTVDEARDVPFRPYVPRHGVGAAAVRIRDRGGRIFHIEERSAIARGLAEASYRLRRWYFHPALAARVRTVAGEDWDRVGSAD